LTQPPQTGDFYYQFYQRELDRRFEDLKNSIDQRFSTIDGDIKELKSDVKKIENAPKDTFRAYVTPIITALITAIVLTYLVSQGVTTK
jgi:hypothetical protein